MKNTTALTLIIVFFTLTSNLQARVLAMFHPHDPTLSAITQVLDRSQKSAQVVLYNIDVTQDSPLIQYMKSEKFQNKLQNGFSFQLIFEGYASPDENQSKMKALENLGVDVRYLGAQQKVHHKFALFDAGLTTETLVTGSANWSMGSMTRYDENLLFIENEPGIASQFSREFFHIWNHSKEFGQTLNHNTTPIPSKKLLGDLHGFFNSVNFLWTERSIMPAHDKPTLTITTVAAIDQAKHSIEVAATRIKLAPIHQALVRAAQRGVKVRVIVSQAEYMGTSARKKVSLRDCGDQIYNRKCSSGMNFAPLLQPEFTGLQNLQIRIKFFNLQLQDYLSHQMHNKYMIIDNRWILTGSFNWSVSSEWNHIENIVVVDGQKHRQALTGFQKNYHYLWNMNRNQSRRLLSGQCQLAPTALTFVEIDLLRSQAAAQGICKQK